MESVTQPSLFKEQRNISVLLTGASGVGKSAIAYHAPQPVIALLLDKPSIDIPPSVAGDQIFYKTFPPASIDLANDKHGRARNIADAIIATVQGVRDSFTRGKPLPEFKTLAGDLVVPPTPRTVIIEGADFLAQHVLNLVCARHNMANPSDFDNPFEAWGLRLVELNALYDMLTYLPGNIVVTTGPHNETKTERVNGKVISQETGVVLPDLGGALCESGPRKFHSSLYVYSDQGRHYVRTRGNTKFKGFKLGGKFGAAELIEVTTSIDKPIQIWDKLFT